VNVFCLRIRQYQIRSWLQHYRRYTQCLVLQLVKNLIGCTS